MAKYASCSFKPKFSDNNTLYTKITNNSDVEATVQIQVNKAGTEANDYEPTPTITAVYVDGEKQENASAYGVELKIPANESVVIANMFDLEKNPDTVAISLNSQEKVAGTVEKGNITVSGISMKTVTDEKELATAEEDKTEQKPEGDKTPSPDLNPDKPDENEGGNGEGNGDNNEEGKEPVTPPAEPEETVIYKLDFSGEKAPENYYCDEEKFEANVGAKIEGAWNNFSIVPVNDASALKDATHIRVTFKCSSDAAFADGDVDNNKFMVGLYKDGGEDNNYAETNVRWTCFLNANEDDFPKDFTLVEKKINWEQKYESDGTTKMPLADFEYTSNFRIWDCNFVTGTLIVQSIEFIKK